MSEAYQIFEKNAQILKSIKLKNRSPTPLSNKAIADAEEHLSAGGDLGVRELKRGHLLQTLLTDGRDSE